MGQHQPLEPAVTRAAVLCLEDRQSQFLVSQHVYLAGTYRVIAATNTPTALKALKSVRAIRAAVLAGQATMEEQLRIASAMEAVRPEVPKLLLNSGAGFDAARAEDLLLFHVDRIDALTEYLRLIVAWSSAAWQRTSSLLEETRELRAESKRLREAMRVLMLRARAQATRFGDKS